MSKKKPAVLCPYCGHLQRKLDRCDECGGLLDEHSRTATQIAMGPWFIRNKDKLFHPGCSFAVLRKQIGAGKVTETSVLRGPTTQQFWQVARRVPGVAHLVGYCHQCHKKVKDRKANTCPACGAAFIEPSQRNELGLRYPSREAVETAQAQLQRQPPTKARNATLAPPPAANEQSHQPAPPPPDDGDLLDEVLGGVSAPPPDPIAAPPDNVHADTDAIDDVSPTAPVPRKRNPPVWLLVVVNIIVLAALAWWFFWHKP